MSNAVAPHLRREVIDATASVLNARTQKEKAEARGQLFGFTKALNLVVSAGDATDGIATGVGRMGDSREIEYLKSYLGGEHEARRLGLIE